MMNEDKDMFCKVLKKSKQPRELSNGDTEAKAAKDEECNQLVHGAAGVQLDFWGGAGGRLGGGGGGGQLQLIGGSEVGGAPALISLPPPTTHNMS